MTTGADAFYADWKSADVEANGIRLHYYRTGGEKPPLVVAHGLTDDGLCRAELARDLSEEFDVICYDARGHGLSTAPPEGYSVEERVADLVGLLEALDLDEPILLGHSMGGNTVATMAARHPEIPRAVILEDPAGMLDPDDDRDAETRATDFRERIEWWHARTKREIIAEDEGIATYDGDGYGDLASRLADARLELSPNAAAIAREGYTDPTVIYPQIRASTLVLKADADGEERERHRRTAALLTDGEIRHVDGSGHCVLRDERAAAMTILRAFLDDLDAA